MSLAPRYRENTVMTVIADSETTTAIPAFRVVKLRRITTAGVGVDLCSATDKAFAVIDMNNNNSYGDYKDLGAGSFNGDYDHLNTRPAPAIMKGVCMIQAGAAGATAGKLVKVTTDGKIVDYVDGAGGNIVGYALTTAANGKYATVLFVPEFQDFQAGGTRAAQELTANGAITFAADYNVCTINKNGVVAATLADPTAADNGKKIVIQSIYAKANTVTAESAGAFDSTYKIFTATGTAALVEKLILVADNGQWTVERADGAFSNP